MSVPSTAIQQAFGLGLSTEFGRSLIGAGGFFEVVEEDVRGEFMATFKNRHASVFDMLRNSVLGGPDREYLSDGERRLTYRQAYTAIARLSRTLREELGVQPGDRVGLFSANSLEWVIGFWATIAAGGIVTAMNSYWSDPETSAALELTTPVAVLADPKRIVQLRAVADEVPTLELSPDLYSDLTRDGDEDPQVHQITEDDVALLLFTSGTTGQPRAVAHSSRGLVFYQQAAVYNALLRLGALPTEMPPPARVLVGPPLFHLSACFSMLMYTASGGLLVLTPGRFDEERTLRTIASERISYWLSLGSAAPRVAMHPSLSTYDIGSLEMVVLGGAPMTPAMRHAVFKAFPGGRENIMMGYGSTEGGGVIATLGGTGFDVHAESAGPVQDGVQVAIRDELGNDLPRGAEGNIWIRSPYTMVGYWGDAETTDQTYGPGRWLSMGDVGRVDPDGLLYINSRARDLIFVSSENVYPSEVENRLEEHPAVLECAVAGIDDPITGQAVKAFVVLKQPVTAESLADWCRGGLPPYKVPSSWELRDQELPRNATGKVLRSALLDGVRNS